MRILHGMREVAGQAYYSRKGLRDNGHDCDLVLWDESPLKYPYDRCLGIDRSKKYLVPVYIVKLLANAIRCARHYDVFHFHFGHSLIPKNLDLPVLRRMGKTIFMEYHGSDMRKRDIAVAANKYWMDVDFGNEEKLNERIAKTVKYVDGLITHDDELLPHFVGLPQPYIVPLRMDVSQFETAYPEIEKEGPVVIAHAPSSRSIKGTDSVIKAVEALKEQYDIEFLLIEGLTQQEAFREYRKADIVVDQLKGGTYGVFAVEAMAMGKPVITYITDAMRERLPEDLPIVSASPDTVEQVLETLITDPKRRAELGRAGRRYAETYHDCQKNAMVLWDIYNGNMEHLTGREAFAYAAGKSPKAGEGATK